jgi:hypothetical protein
MFAHLETVIASTAAVPSHLATLMVLEMPVINQRSHSVAGNDAHLRALGYGDAPSRARSRKRSPGSTPGTWRP